MLKKTVIWIASSILTFSLALFAFGRSSSPRIILEKGNFAVLRGMVDDYTVSDIIRQINVSDHSKTFYLYIDSFGGEVIAGNRLVAFLKGTDVKVEVVVQSAASMAAVITESVKVRHITETGFLMFHHIQTGIQGDLEQVKARVKFSELLEETLDKIVAERVGISIEKYREILGFELFMNARLALELNFIDDTVTVSCDPDLAAKVEKGISGCPL